MSISACFRNVKYCYIFSKRSPLVKQRGKGKNLHANASPRHANSPEATGFEPTRTSRMVSAATNVRKETGPSGFLHLFILTCLIPFLLRFIFLLCRVCLYVLSFCIFTPMPYHLFRKHGLKLSLFLYFAFLKQANTILVEEL